MPDIDLEEVLVKALRRGKVPLVGKVFGIGNAAVLANYMFGDMVVVFMDSPDEEKLRKYQSFKKSYPHYQIVLVSKDCGSFLDNKFFSEMYDEKGIKDLVRKIKKVMEIGTN